MDGGKTIGKNRIDCSCFLSRGETERGEFPGIISPFTEMTGEDEQGARGEGAIVIPCMFLEGPFNEFLGVHLTA